MFTSAATGNDDTAVRNGAEYVVPAEAGVAPPKTAVATKTAAVAREAKERRDMGEFLARVNGDAQLHQR